MEALFFPDFKNLVKEMHPLEEYGAKYDYRGEFQKLKKHYGNH